MKIVLQRVLEASVEIDGITVGEIGRGYLLLVGVSNDDSYEIADKLIEKIARLRIFEDSDGKTNLSIDRVGGEVLVISQFTLYANCKKGNRPSFVNAGTPEFAEDIYNYILGRCKELFNKTQSGKFGADMKVSLVNDGPFTIVLDSAELIHAQ